MSGLTGVRHADPCTCQRCCRKAAFGAIRRAAAVARHWQNDQEEVCGEAAAFYIRQAIRAAIGSEKTS